MLVFIPAYRCERQIGRVLHRLAELAAGWPDPIAEVLVLDNQSPDNTLEAAKSAAQALGLGKVSVGRNRQNYGLGGSHKVAFEYALRQGYSHVVVLHGDDQGDLADLRPVVDRGDHRRNDACLGSRFMRGASLQNYSLFRTCGNRVFNALFSAVGRRWVTDLGSGLNCYSTASLQSRYWWSFADDLKFNYYMILSHMLRKDAFTFFPISWREDDQVSNVKMASQAFDTLRLLGAAAVGGQAFLSQEHRNVSHTSYDFEFVVQQA